MKNRYKLCYIPILLLMIFLTSGCRMDNMEDIHIVVTDYPSEFILTRLYGRHATITKMFPDGVDIRNYNLTNRQLDLFSRNDLFVYNGLIERDRNIAMSLLDRNNRLMIIDTSFVLDQPASPEELWLNPSSLLMMTRNVRNALEEYVTSQYLRDSINEAYQILRTELSELAADYRLAIENARYNTIVTANNGFRFLTRFGFNVISIDVDATQADIREVIRLIDAGYISYIFNFRGDSLNPIIQEIYDSFDHLNILFLHRLDNLSDEDRNNNRDYISIMQENLNTLKRELH